MGDFRGGSEDSTALGEEGAGGDGLGADDAEVGAGSGAVGTNCGEGAWNIRDG